MTRHHRPLFVPLIGGGVAILALAGVATAGAPVEKSAVDQITQSYEVPVTNHADGVTISDVLTVTSATLDTLNPDGSGVSAPSGRIYLSLQVTSSPPQVSSTSPAWGHFFSTMTPIPGSAWRYVASSGIKYVATRVNPVDQTFNSNATTDDGMVDATYYFTVPLSTRAGTIELLPTRTLGVEYTGFVGGVSVIMSVGGPIKIPVHFPKDLTVTTTTTTTISSVAPPSGGSSSSTLSVVLLVIMLIFIAAIERRRRQRLAARRRRTPTVPPAQYAPTPPRTAPTPRPQPEPPTGDAVVTSAPEPEPVEVTDVPQTTELRVDILGPLSIAPTLTSPSDPVRAIVAYLAMNSERALTMDEIQNAVWPLTADGTDIKRTVMRNYMADVRRCVGDIHLPSAARGAGYQLVVVGTDWDEFQRLVAQSEKAPKPDAVRLKLQALDLVKGPPFTADTSRYFTWAFSASIVYQIISIVTQVAHDVSAHLVMAGDLKGAEEALRRGLMIEPASLPLWEDLTDVLLETTDQSLMDVHWKAATLLLGPEDVTALRARENG